MRNAEAWNKLTSKEGGLAEMQIEVLNNLNIEELAVEEIENLRNQCKDKTERGSNEEEWYLDGIEELECHRFNDFLYTQRPERTSMNPLYFYTDFDDNNKPTSPTDLFETAGVMREIVGRVVSNSDFDKYDTNDPKESELLGYTDLGNKKKIILDNVQTLLDVFRVFLGDEEDVQSRNQIMLHMSSEHFGEKIVTQYETPLQLSSRAPFFFWARARREVPILYKGKPIRDGYGYNADFLNFVVRGNIRNIKETEMSRTGGCPVAHKDFKHLDLINSFGAQFANLHRRIYIPTSN